MAKMSTFYNNGLVLKTTDISNGIVKKLLTIDFFFSNANDKSVK